MATRGTVLGGLRSMLAQNLLYVSCFTEHVHSERHFSNAVEGPVHVCLHEVVCSGWHCSLHAAMRIMHDSRSSGNMSIILQGVCCCLA